MRQTIFWITLGLGVSAFACGGSSKPANEPGAAAANTSAEPPPKWDDTSESADGARHPQFASSPSSASSPASGDPSKPGPAAPVVASSPSQRRTDSYDKEATEVVLKRAARQVKDNCGSAKDENGKAGGPWGKAVVSVNLGHNGHSRGATIAAPFDGKPTGRCAIQAFANLTYPPWAGADTTVSWDVDIAPPKDAK